VICIFHKLHQLMSPCFQKQKSENRKTFPKSLTFSKVNWFIVPQPQPIQPNKQLTYMYMYIYVWISTGLLTDIFSFCVKIQDKFHVSKNSTILTHHPNQTMQNYIQTFTQTKEHKSRREQNCFLQLTLPNSKTKLWKLWCMRSKLQISLF
jgi:hypothetical protein